MAQHSNSSDSGNWLVRGFMGILSITATAVVSTMVQRYFSSAPTSWTPAPAPPAAQLSPNVDPSVSDSASPTSPSLETNQAGMNQAETNQAGVSQSDRAAGVGLSTDSPIQVETQPVPDGSYSQVNENPSEPPAAPEASSEATLREKLDSALRDKWNKH